MRSAQAGQHTACVAVAQDRSGCLSGRTRGAAWIPVAMGKWITMWARHNTRYAGVRARRRWTKLVRVAAANSRASAELFARDDLEDGGNADMAISRGHAA